MVNSHHSITIGVYIYICVFFATHILHSKSRDHNQYSLWHPLTHQIAHHRMAHPTVNVHFKRVMVDAFC